jgi:hypothetical protein
MSAKRSVSHRVSLSATQLSAEDSPYANDFHTPTSAEDRHLEAFRGSKAFERLQKWSDTVTTIVVDWEAHREDVTVRVTEDDIEWKTYTLRPEESLDSLIDKDDWRAFKYGTIDKEVSLTNTLENQDLADDTLTLELRKMDSGKQFCTFHMKDPFGGEGPVSCTLEESAEYLLLQSGLDKVGYYMLHSPSETRIDVTKKIKHYASLRGARLLILEK